MKKLVSILVTFVLVMTIMSAMAEKTIHEDMIHEHIISESAPIEDVEKVSELKKEHREPNYVVTIGGDKLVDINVNHHPEFVLKIGEGVHWVGEKVSNLWDKAKGIFVKNDEV